MPSKSDLPDWVRLTKHPVIVRTRYSTNESPVFEGASPHLAGDQREIFLGALRPDLSACRLEKAQRVFRQIPADKSVIAPETCTPYVDANALGYYVLNELPLVFVRTSKGDLLPDTRVAIKYMRENASRFSDTLALLAKHAPQAFQPNVYPELLARHPLLFSDVAQPYASFSDAHMAMRMGCYVMTPPGVGVMLGPPINQRPLLPLHSGLMESEWHHSELFLVFDCPEFTGQVLIIEPGSTLAQLYFVAKAADEESQVIFSDEHLGAEPAYRARSMEVGFQLLATEKDFVISKMTGTKSVSVACPHCWISVTAAAEVGVPEDHVQVQDFYQGYKALRAEYHEAVRRQRKPKRSQNGTTRGGRI